MIETAICVGAILAIIVLIISMLPRRRFDQDEYEEDTFDPEEDDNINNL
jgi:hypothetical protein